MKENNTNFIVVTKKSNNSKLHINVNYIVSYEKSPMNTNETCIETISNIHTVKESEEKVSELLSKLNTNEDKPMIL